MAKNKGNYESGIVNLQGMQSIMCISRELLHVDKTSGMSRCEERACMCIRLGLWACVLEYKFTHSSLLALHFMWHYIW